MDPWRPDLVSRRRTARWRSSARGPWQRASANRKPIASRPSSTRIVAIGNTKSAAGTQADHADHRHRAQRLLRVPRAGRRFPSASSIRPERARRRPGRARAASISTPSASRSSAAGSIRWPTSPARCRSPRPGSSSPRTAWAGSSSSRPRSPGVTGPEDACCRSSSATTLGPRRSPRHQHGRAVRAARPYPRDPSQRGDGHDRPVSAERRMRLPAAAPEPAGSARTPRDMDPLASALQFLKGVGPRRAADLAARRPPHGRRSALSFSDPLRGSRRASGVASLRPGMSVSVIGEVSAGVRPTRRPRFRLFELLVRDAPARSAPSFNQPFLARRLPSASAGGAVRQARMSWHGLQLQNPQYEIVRRRGR